VIATGFGKENARDYQNQMAQLQALSQAQSHQQNPNSQHFYYQVANQAPVYSGTTMQQSRQNEVRQETAQQQSYTSTPPSAPHYGQTQSYQSYQQTSQPQSPGVPQAPAAVMPTTPAGFQAPSWTSRPDEIDAPSIPAPTFTESLQEAVAQSGVPVFTQVTQESRERLTPMAPTQMSGKHPDPLPRDVLLAKARAFRDAQKPGAPGEEPQQLSMNMEVEEPSLDSARKMAQEVSRSPFDFRNLEIPAYLRKGKQPDSDKV
jgi:cell division protein FtsZ